MSEVVRPRMEPFFDLAPNGPLEWIFTDFCVFRREKIKKGQRLFSYDLRQTLIFEKRARERENADRVVDNYSRRPEYNWNCSCRVLVGERAKE